MYVFVARNGARVRVPERHLNGSEHLVGYCLSCGSRRDHVEGDARGYTCDRCGKKTVWGGEELLIAGLLT
jgi:ribosomal protein L37AE/L43A